MKETNEDYYAVGDVFRRIRSFFSYLGKKWWLFAMAIFLGTALGFLYYKIQKPKYEAECTFIVEEKQSGMGGLSGLASQFGFDISGMAGGNIFAGDNILDILKSRKIVRQVLLSSATQSGKGATLADLFVGFSGLRREWKDKPELANVSFENSTVLLNQLQDSVLNIVYEKVVTKHLSAERVNKKGTLIRVNVTAADDFFAKAATERLVNEASKMYLSIKTGTAQENVNRMQRRSDSLLYLLNRKSYTAAAAQPLDVNPGIREAIVPTEIAVRDKSVIATLYAEVTRNLEASKLLLSQQTPIIQVIDKPSLSLFDNKRKLWVLIALGILLCEVACFFLLSSTYAVIKLRSL